jgi:hypothetical protein
MAGASTARPSERTTKRFIFFAETDAGATGGLQRATIQTSQPNSFYCACASDRVGRLCYHSHTFLSPRCAHAI